MLLVFLWPRADRISAIPGIVSLVDYDDRARGRRSDWCGGIRRPVRMVVGSPRRSLHLTDI